MAILRGALKAVKVVGEMEMEMEMQMFKGFKENCVLLLRWV